MTVLALLAASLIAHVTSAKEHLIAIESVQYPGYFVSASLGNGDPMANGLRLTQNLNGTDRIGDAELFVLDVQPDDYNGGRLASLRPLTGDYAYINQGFGEFPCMCNTPPDSSPPQPSTGSNEGQANPSFKHGSEPDWDPGTEASCSPQLTDPYWADPVSWPSQNPYCITNFDPNSYCGDRPRFSTYAYQFRLSDYDTSADYFEASIQQDTSNGDFLSSSCCPNDSDYGMLCASSDGTHAHSRFRIWILKPSPAAQQPPRFVTIHSTVATDIEDDEAIEAFVRVGSSADTVLTQAGQPGVADTWHMYITQNGDVQLQSKHGKYLTVTQGNVRAWATASWGWIMHWERLHLSYFSADTYLLRNKYTGQYLVRLDDGSLSAMSPGEIVDQGNDGYENLRRAMFTIVEQEQGVHFTSDRLVKIHSSTGGSLFATDTGIDTVSASNLPRFESRFRFVEDHDGQVVIYGYDGRGLMADGSWSTTPETFEVIRDLPFLSNGEIVLRRADGQFVALEGAALVGKDFYHAGMVFSVADDQPEAPAAKMVGIRARDGAAETDPLGRVHLSTATDACATGACFVRRLEDGERFEQLTYDDGDVLFRTTSGEYLAVAGDGTLGLTTYPSAPAIFRLSASALPTGPQSETMTLLAHNGLCVRHAGAGVSVAADVACDAQSAPQGFDLVDLAAFPVFQRVKMRFNDISQCAVRGLQGKMYRKLYQTQYADDFASDNTWILEEAPTRPSP